MMLTRITIFLEIWMLIAYKSTRTSYVGPRRVSSEPRHARGVISLPQSQP